MLFRAIGILAAALALSACGTTGSADGPGEATPAPTPVLDGSDASEDAVADHLQDLARRKDAARRRGDHDAAEELEQAMRAIERAQDEAIEQEFSGTPFDAAVDELPLRRPPLFVEQVMTDEDAHDVVVRVRRRAFLCEIGQRARLAAVRDYFAAADRIMRAHGIDDFSLTVDALRESGVVRPLARADRDGAELTARGRAGC